MIWVASYTSFDEDFYSLVNEEPPSGGPNYPISVEIATDIVSFIESPRCTPVTTIAVLTTTKDNNYDDQGTFTGIEDKDCQDLVILGEDIQGEPDVFTVASQTMKSPRLARKKEKMKTVSF